MAGLMAQGQTVGLATDTGGGSSFSMLRTMAAAYEIGQLRGTPLHAAQLLWLATVGSARALHMDGRIGNLQVGHEADLIVLDLASTPAIAQRTAQAKDIWESLFATIMVFAFGAAINKLSVAGAQLFFYAFAAVMGLSMAWIFVAFTGLSIANVFLVTSISFAGLSLYGYTTKKDLSAMGTFLMMGVIGLIVAMVVNIFLQSPAMMFAISILGVLIFAGLTAYDTQKIKTEYIQHAAHETVPHPATDDSR